MPNLFGPVRKIQSSTILTERLQQTGTSINPLTVTWVNKAIIPTPPSRPCDPDWLIDSAIFDHATGDHGKHTFAAGDYFLFLLGAKGPFVAFELDISSVSVSGLGHVNVGFTDVSKNGYVFNFDVPNNQAKLFQFSNNAATVTDLTAYAPLTYSESMSLGLSIVDRSLLAWVKDADGWRVFAAVDLATAAFDPRSPSVLAGLRLYFGPYQCSVIASAVRAGYPQPSGYANLHPILDEQGTPIRRGRKLYYCGNTAFPAYGSSARLIAASLFSIFELNEEDYSFRTVSRIITTRGGLLFGENSGSVMLDRLNQRFQLFIPNWGDGGATGSVRTYLYSTPLDITAGGVHVLPAGTLLTLPAGAATGIDRYDPSVSYEGGLYKLIYTAGDERYLTLATNPSLSATGWTLLGQRTADGLQEGAQWVNVGGVRRAAAVRFSNQHIYWYDNTLTTLGHVASPFTNLSGLTYPHPAIVIRPDGYTSRLLYVGHDDTLYQGQAFTWGRLAIYESSETQTGWETPIYQMPGAGK